MCPSPTSTGQGGIFASLLCTSILYGRREWRIERDNPIYHVCNGLLLPLYRDFVKYVIDPTSRSGKVSLQFLSVPIFYLFLLLSSPCVSLSQSSWACLSSLASILSQTEVRSQALLLILRRNPIMVTFSAFQNFVADFKAYGEGSHGTVHKILCIHGCTTLPSLLGSTRKTSWRRWCWTWS